MIEPEEVVQKTGYSRPNTVHCRPEGIYIGTLDGVGADRTPGAFEHESVMALMGSNVGMAVGVSLLHSASMVASGLVAAWVVYRHLGLRALRATWLNLDVVWSPAGATIVATLVFVAMGSLLGRR